MSSRHRLPVAERDHRASARVITPQASGTFSSYPSIRNGPSASSDGRTSRRTGTQAHSRPSTNSGASSVPPGVQNSQSSAPPSPASHRSVPPVPTAHLSSHPPAAFSSIFSPPPARPACAGTSRQRAPVSAGRGEFFAFPRQERPHPPRHRRAPRPLLLVHRRPVRRARLCREAMLHLQGERSPPSPHTQTPPHPRLRRRWAPTQAACDLVLGSYDNAIFAHRCRCRTGSEATSWTSAGW